MIYAYELLSHLKHLTLTGNTEEGLEFVGTDAQWKLSQKEIETYEEWNQDDFTNSKTEDYGL